MKQSQIRDDIASFDLTGLWEDLKKLKNNTYKAEYLESEGEVPPNEIETADKLDYIQIDSLNKATLNFSGHSLETKKLCVTVLTSVITIMLGFYKTGPKETLNMVRWVGATVVFIFYVVDCFLYWYQDKLREGIIKQENNIRKRHNIDPLKFRQPKGRLFRTIINRSHFIYYALFAAIIAFTTYHIQNMK